GPHMTALAWIGIALAAGFRAIERWRPAALGCAAVACAMVVSNNFYGATALAVWYSILVWSLWIAHLDRAMWLRAAAVPLLAVALTAFWLTPSYVSVTMANLKLVAQPGNSWSAWLALAVIAAFAAATAKWARGRPGAAWTVFVAGSLVLFSLNVLGEYYFKFRVAGEPSRLAPELDLAIILAAVEALRRLWPRGRVAKAACVALAFAALWPSKRYVRHAWEIYPRDFEPHYRLEYRITEWMARNRPHDRALATGTVRFWYNAWFDLPQLGGGSEQGLVNPLVNLAYLRIAIADGTEEALLWAKAFGVSVLLVHEEESTEHYRDYVNPKRFRRSMPVLYDDGKGNVIYQVPRSHSAIARVVSRQRMAALPAGPPNDLGVLRAYVEAVETEPLVRTTWEGTDALRVQAPVSEGESLVVQVSYDPAWRASASGRAVAIRKDPYGQMIVDAPPGAREVRLVFEPPLDSRIGRAVSAAALLAVAGLIARGARR
ncbi:MAG: hypothetical protein ACRD96_27755, partial [Bryobacteraceae bacterium]